MNALPSKFALAAAMAGGLALAGCATSPYGNNRNYDRGYQGQQSGYGYGDRNVRCQTCGVVQEVQQVYTDGGGNGGTLGAIIGAVAGGVLGNQVGKGDGRTAATIGGAVIGGAIGNKVARNNDQYDQYQDSSGVVRRCRTVSDGEGMRRFEGYNVTYRYAGHTYHAITTYNPGRRMHVVVNVRPQDGDVAYSH